MCRIAGRLGSVHASVRGVSGEIPALLTFDPNLEGESVRWAV